MVSRNSFSVGIIMLFIGVALGYNIAPLTETNNEASEEYQKLQAETVRFRSHGLPCIPAFRETIQMTQDTWIIYNYNEEGDLIMMGIKTTEEQNTAIWAHLPEGRPGLEFEFWAIHIWFEEIEEACLNLERMIEKLRSEGLTVEPADEIEQPFFSVKGQIIHVNGGQLQVFEYDDVATTTKEAASVSPDGSSIGNTKIEWSDTPHFYHNGKMIILYVGHDEELLQTFEETIGFTFARG
jgi:hypothetical protein